jgi:large subunit ribosomal protein L23
VVPLEFNKLDLRDYLYHAYNVEVTSVRSFINQPSPRQKYGSIGKWYRPRSQKMMIVELVKPFVWPDPPAEKDREPFDYKIFKKMEKERSESMKRHMDPANIPLRTQQPTSEVRAALKQQAKEFLDSGEWSNGRKGDDKWTEVETEVTGSEGAMTNKK